MHPVGVSAAAGRLPGADRLAAARAGFPGRVGGVIFAGVPAGFGGPGVGELLALHGDIALIGCVSEHQNSLLASRLTGTLPSWPRH
jgi:hypothetical protein